MSHSIMSKKNKQQKHLGVNSIQYIGDYNEPQDPIDRDDADGREQNIKLQKQSDRYYLIIRQRIKRNAQRLRNALPYKTEI